MDWGMKNRLSQLIKPDGKCFFMPIDHGYFQGPTSGLEKPAETIKPVIGYCDALFVTRGTLRACIDAATSKPVILRVSGGTSMVGQDLANETLTTSIDEILRLNASAVGVSVFIGSDYEKQTLSNLAQMVNLCEPYGVPVMAVTAVGKEMDKREARYLALCCRICAELGARVVKTYFCDKDFSKVVAGCPVPVVIAGGPKCETETEVFEFVYSGLEDGAIGVNLGRNVWQSPHPAAMARALQAVIHEGADVKKAKKIFDEVKGR
ncbi:MAG TPA: 3-hydroxy-5-phosphonooxypentane-2,4-dione thiolase [Candidatus Omnitrophota bacterium]|nr:3-hydroxy-5-phosphonooxypentane-2,4-dione thiolase [Candidatus Omnitrophota bacterium]